MRFLLTKEKELRPLLVVLINGVLIALSIYLIMDIVLHAVTLGMTPDALRTTLYGSEEQFVEPMPFGTLLLQVHTDLFMTLFVVLILASISVRVLETARAKRIILHLLGLTGVFTPIFLLIAYFTTYTVLFIWLLFFLGWHLLTLVLSCFLIWKVMR